MQDGLWQAVLGEIELSVSRASYLTWFKNTRLLKHKDDMLVIGVPNVFIKQQLERKFNQLVVDTLKKNGVTTTHIEYKIHSGISSLHKKVEDTPVILASPTEKSTKPTSSLTHTYRQGLNERYTFENFVVGS